MHDVSGLCNRPGRYTYIAQYLLTLRSRKANKLWQHFGVKPVMHQFDISHDVTPPTLNSG